jgi:hypothetical protein
VKTSGTIHAKNCLHRGMWNDIMIRQHSEYVDAFSDSFTQHNCYVTMDIAMFDGVRTFCSYSQLSWIVYFIQNLLPRSIVILMLLPVLARPQFSLTLCLQVCAIACQSAISGMFKNISQAKARASGVLPKVVAKVVCIACIAVASESSIRFLS